MAKRDIAILGRSGSKAEKPGVAVIPDTPVDEDEEDRIMMKDDD
jgi:hypothetical protein